MDLGRGFSAVVKVSARLNLHTLTQVGLNTHTHTHRGEGSVVILCFVLQTSYLNYDLVSSASYDVISAPSKVQPLLLTSGHTQVINNH